MRSLSLYLATLAGVLLAWWLLTTLLGPLIIGLIHSGTEIPLLSQLMAGRETTPLERYLSSWANVRRNGMVALALVGSMSLPLTIGSLPVAARLAEAGRSVGPSWKTSGLLLAGLLVAICGLVPLLLYVDPVAYVYAITDDFWAEYGTFASFMIAALLFGRATLAQPGLRKVGLLAFTLAALFVGLEEISWGQRIIGFDTPEALEQYNAQGETNLHNIWFPTRRAIGLGLLAFAAGLPWLRRRSRLVDRLITRFGVPVPPAFVWPPFAVAAFLFVFGENLVPPPDGKMDEVAELALGLVILLLGTHAILRARADRKLAERALFPATICCTVTAAVVTVGLVYSAPNPNGLTWRLNQFAAERFPRTGRTDAALALFEYMEEHEEYRTDRTRIEYGRLLQSRGRDEKAEEVLRSALAELNAEPESTDEDSIERQRLRVEVLTILRRTQEPERVDR